jgi:RNA polymerase sigma-70 factor (family 1)
MEIAVKDRDKKLVEQLRDGSKDAFHMLYSEYGPQIHAFALSYLKNNADAEELLQDVFLKIWEMHCSVDAEKNFRSFLFRISINLIYDFIRRKNIQRAYLDYFDSDLRPQSDNTWEEVIYNDMLDNLQKLVSSMPKQRRRIFRMSKEEGLSNEEIARKLGLSQRTVESHLYFAVAFLKGKLGTGSLPALLFFYLHCQ